MNAFTLIVPTLATLWRRRPCFDVQTTHVHFNFDNFALFDDANFTVLFAVVTTFLRPSIDHLFKTMLLKCPLARAWARNVAGTAWLVRSGLGSSRSACLLPHFLATVLHETGLGSCGWPQHRLYYLQGL
jgi:hypothetical protein